MAYHLIEKCKMYGIFVYSIGDIRDFREFVTVVYIFGHEFRFTDIYAAFDFCFKSFFALNVKYPDLCCNLWYLIQKVVYNVTHFDDNINSSTDAEYFINVLKTKVPHFYQ